MVGERGEGMDGCGMVGTDGCMEDEEKKMNGWEWRRQKGTGHRSHWLGLERGRKSGKWGGKCGWLGTRGEAHEG